SDLPVPCMPSLAVMFGSVGRLPIGDAARQRLMSLRKLEYTRSGLPTTDIFSKRFTIVVPDELSSAARPGDSVFQSVEYGSKALKVWVTAFVGGGSSIVGCRSAPLCLFSASSARDMLVTNRTLARYARPLE